MRQLHDVAIIGGGPVGAVLGSLLCRTPSARRLSVVLIERSLPPALPPGEDVRVFALSRASQHILENAAVWPSLLAQPRVLTAYRRMHVWPATAAARGAGSLTFDAAELGEPDLGCIVANSALQQAAVQAFQAAGGTLRRAAVSELAFLGDAVRLDLSAAGESPPVHARLVVGADGAGSVVRQAAGLSLEAQSYQQLAIVANVHAQHGHEATAWQRFLGEGTLALLPLTDAAPERHLISLVWSLPQARALDLLALPTEAFERELTAASEAVLGKLQLVSERRSFPLRRSLSEDYVRERIALVGDAAHIIHPLAGQGANLGLLDAATLAETVLGAVAEGEDPGALRSLRRYQRWRQGENVAMAMAMEAFNRLLAFGGDEFSRLAGRGMGWVGRSPVLRRFFAQQALGVTGARPRAARFS